MFARYSPSNCTVTLKLGLGPLKVIKNATIRWLGYVSYSTSIATMAVSRTVSEIHRLIGQKSPIFLTHLLFGAPVRYEAVRAKH